MAIVRFPLKSAAETFPREGVRELVDILDFTSVGTFAADLFQEMAAGQIESIQCVYIDNSLNNAQLILLINGVQTITAQPLTQGIYPVICQGPLRYQATSSQGQTITVVWSNVAKDFNVWGPIPGTTVTPPLTNQVVELAPSAAGDNIVIPGVGGQTIKVYRTILGFGAGTNAKFWSGASAANHPLTGTFPMFAGGSITMQSSGQPWMTTRTGDGLNLNSSAAVNIGGTIGFVQS